MKQHLLGLVLSRFFDGFSVEDELKALFGASSPLNLSNLLV
jgi:hypothetical protein